MGVTEKNNFFANEKAPNCNVYIDKCIIHTTNDLSNKWIKILRTWVIIALQ